MVASSSDGDGTGGTSNGADVRSRDRRPMAKMFRRSLSVGEVKDDIEENREIIGRANALLHHKPVIIILCLVGAEFGCGGS